MDRCFRTHATPFTMHNQQDPTPYPSTSFRENLLFDQDPAPTVMLAPISQADVFADLWEDSIKLTPDLQAQQHDHPNTSSIELMDQADFDANIMLDDTLDNCENSLSSDSTISINTELSAPSFKELHDIYQLQMAMGQSTTFPDYNDKKLKTIPKQHADTALLHINKLFKFTSYMPALHVLQILQNHIGEQAALSKGQVSALIHEEYHDFLSHALDAISSSYEQEEDREISFDSIAFNDICAQTTQDTPSVISELIYHAGFFPMMDLYGYLCAHKEKYTQALYLDLQRSVTTKIIVQTTHANKSHECPISLLMPDSLRHASSWFQQNNLITKEEIDWLIILLMDIHKQNNDFPIINRNALRHYTQTNDNKISSLCKGQINKPIVQSLLKRIQKAVSRHNKVPPAYFHISPQMRDELIELYNMILLIPELNHASTLASISLAARYCITCKELMHTSCILEPTKAYAIKSLLSIFLQIHDTRTSVRNPRPKQFVITECFKKDQLLLLQGSQKAPNAYVNKILAYVGKTELIELRAFLSRASDRDISIKDPFYMAICHRFITIAKQQAETASVFVDTEIHLATNELQLKARDNLIVLTLISDVLDRDSLAAKQQKASHMHLAQ